VMEYHTHCHKVFELRPDTLIDVLHNIGAFKDDSRLDDFLLACEADARGRTGLECQPYPQADYIREAFRVAVAVDIRGVVQSELRGAQIGLAIRQLRCKAVNAYKQTFDDNFSLPT